MVKFLPTKSNIHFIARGLLIQNENIIICKAKGNDWYFFPGGHIENGESAKNALIRELKEESNIETKEALFIGSCENIFNYNEEFSQHEVNFVFKIDIPENTTIASIENHLEYIPIKKEDFMKYKILPEKIQTGIKEWLDTGTTFFKEL